MTVPGVTGANVSVSSPQKAQCKRPGRSVGTAVECRVSGSHSSSILTRTLSKGHGGKVAFLRVPATRDRKLLCEVENAEKGKRSM